MLRSRPAAVELPADQKLPGLTAQQTLMVDLLQARHRLGEPFWPVSTKLYRTYNELHTKGYVEVLDGNVERTVRLRFTRRAHKELIEDSTYVTPLQGQLATHIADSIEMSGGDPTTVRMIRKQFAGKGR
jgi:hypothetical protein